MPQRKRTVGENWLRGNPGKRRNVRSRPEVASVSVRRSPSRLPKALAPPSHLDEAAARFWREQAPDLFRIGWLNASGRTQLERVANQYSKLLRLEQAVRESSEFIKSGKGVALSPLVARIDKYGREISKFLLMTSKLISEHDAKAADDTPMDASLRDAEIETIAFTLSRNPFDREGRAMLDGLTDAASVLTVLNRAEDLYIERQDRLGSCSRQSALEGALRAATEL